jgi:hypothetical protein
MATKANRLACMLGVALGSMVLGCAPVLLAAWLGHRYYQADLATCLMTIGLLIGIPRQTGGVTIYAMGRVGYGARARVVALVVNLVVTVALVGPLGMPGVLIGTVLAIITSTAYLQIRVNQLLGIGLWESTGRWALPLVLATIPAVILDRIVLELLPASVQSHRIDALGALVILTIVNYVSFIMGLRASRFLGPDDVAYLRTALPGPVARLTRPWMFRLIVRGFTPA